MGTSLIPYYNHTTSRTFSRTSVSEKKTAWTVGSRPLGQPYTLSVERRVAPQGAKVNDHVIVRNSRTENNVTTGLPATAVVTLDISVPRDASILTTQVVTDMITEIASLLDDSNAPVTTTFAQIGKLVTASELVTV